jgi:hypothetical protein
MLSWPFRTWNFCEQGERSQYIWWDCTVRFVFTEPCFGVERKKIGESGAYPFEVNDVYLEGKAACFLIIDAMAEHADKWLSCQGILQCLTETGAILYTRGAFCGSGLC